MIIFLVLLSHMPHFGTCLQTPGASCELYCHLQRTLWDVCGQLWNVLSLVVCSVKMCVRDVQAYQLPVLFHTCMCKMCRSTNSLCSFNHVCAGRPGVPTPCFLSFIYVRDVQEYQLPVLFQPCMCGMCRRINCLSILLMTG
jgi:hypothetical protein